MSFRLLPKDVKFFDLFVADGENLQAAATKLRDLIEKFDDLDARIAEIQLLEKRGDDIDREDIHDLTIQLDDVVDGIQSVAETMAIYGIDRPTEEARKLAQILADQADSLVSALRKLDGLKDLDADLTRVHDLEHEADTLSRAAVARLFREGTDPLHVIKWRDLYRELENAIDAAEDAAEAIERMFHKAT